MSDIDLTSALRRIAHDLPDGEYLLTLRRVVDGRVRRLHLFGRGAGPLAGEVERQCEGVAPDSAHPDDRQALAIEFRSARPGDQGDVEYRVIDEEGREHRVHERYRVLQPEAGILTVVGVLRNATAEREMEKRLRALEHRSASSQRLEAVGALTAGIAHDFNNLLVGIYSTVELIGDVELPEEARDDLAMLRSTAERGRLLVRKLMDFAARNERETDEGIGGPLDPLRGLATLLERTLSKNIEVRVDFAEELPPVAADVSRIEQAVLNLALNARDAMPEGGQLRLSLKPVRLEKPVETAPGSPALSPGRYLSIEVADDGEGIDESVRDRIFEPFFSTKGAEREGAGLGLDTVLRTVRECGGGIQLESRVGEGTTFRLFLPVLESEEELPAEVIAEVADPKGLRVLVVEDDAQVRRVIRRTLERAGYGVWVASTASEALRLFDRVRPPTDLLISDVGLPDRTGIELGVALRRRRPDLPIVLTSGYLSDERALREIRGGGVLFLPKPFSARTLIDSIERVSAALESGVDHQVADGG